MTKPNAYFPASALPNFQELSAATDTDPLGIVGSITQRGDVTLTSGYAGSGATTVSVSGGFAAWPAYGLFQNLTTGEQIAFIRTNNNDLNVLAAGRALNGTSPAAGNVGHVIRFIEKRALGRTMNQIIAELTAHDEFLRSGIGLNLVANGGAEFFQRGGISGAVSMTNAVYNAPDRFFSLVQGAGPTIQQQAAPSGFTGTHAMRIVSGGTTNRGGICQALEFRDVKRFRSWPVTASVRVRAFKNAGSGSINVRWAVLEWTGTADAPTKSLVNSWASGTYTPGNFFINTSYNVLAVGSAAVAHNTVSKITVDATPGASANNLVLMVWLQDVPAHASDYIEVGDVALNPGRVAPPLWTPRALDERPHCLRYCYVFESSNLNDYPGWVGVAVSNNYLVGMLSLPAQMRTRPAITITPGDWNGYDGTTAAALGTVSIPGTANTLVNPNAIRIDLQPASGTPWVAGRAALWQSNAAAPRRFILEAEL